MACAADVVQHPGPAWAIASVSTLTKVPTGLLAVTLLLAGAGTSHAEVRIARDLGGLHCADK